MRSTNSDHEAADVRRKFIRENTVTDNIKPQRPDLVARLAAELVSLEDGAPTFAFVADKLGVSHRTLRRRLRELGTSYSKVLAMVRLEAARQRLANDNLTIDEIAYQLGYTEPTNFRHAFRRWTGLAPSAYRAS